MKIHHIFTCFFDHSFSSVTINYLSFTTAQSSLYIPAPVPQHTNIDAKLLDPLTELLNPMCHYLKHSSSQLSSIHSIFNDKILSVVEVKGSQITNQYKKQLIIIINVTKSTFPIKKLQKIFFSLEHIEYSIVLYTNGSYQILNKNFDIQHTSTSFSIQQFVSSKLNLFSYPTEVYFFIDNMDISDFEIIPLCDKGIHISFYYNQLPLFLFPNHLHSLNCVFIHNTFSDNEIEELQPMFNSRALESMILSTSTKECIQQQRLLPALFPTSRILIATQTENISPELTFSIPFTKFRCNSTQINFCIHSSIVQVFSLTPNMFITKQPLEQCIQNFSKRMDYHAQTNIKQRAARKKAEREKMLQERIIKRKSSTLSPEKINESLNSPQSTQRVIIQRSKKKQDPSITLPLKTSAEHKPMRSKHVLLSPKLTTSTPATQLQESTPGQVEAPKALKQRPSFQSLKQMGLCASATILPSSASLQLSNTTLPSIPENFKSQNGVLDERDERNKKWNEINKSCQGDCKAFVLVHQNDVLANITFLLIQRHVRLYSSELFQELYQKIELLFNDNEFLKLIRRDYVSVVDIKEFITTNNFLLNLPKISNTSIYVSEHTGPRSRMEDSTSFIEDIYQFANIPKVNETDTMKYIGLFDGHLGSGASYYCHWSIPYRLCSSNLSDISKALRNSFIETDNSLTQLTRSFKFNCGTTAVCSIITNTHIYTANVGDSEAYLCSKNQLPKQLSYKHLADSVDEKERIQSSGGKIFNLKGSRVEASDGLFNVVPSAVACCIVRSLLAEIVPDVLTNHEITFPINKQDICNWLVKYALEQGSMDNVSVVILYF
ncbi:hypothetical protein QTN25_005097 [Entamoeba marina]